MLIFSFIVLALFNPDLLMQYEKVPVTSIKLKQILTDFNFQQPRGIEVDREGNLYILEQKNHRLSVFNKNLEYLYSFPEVGLKVGAFYYPQDFVIRGDECYILHSMKVSIFRTDGKFIREFSIHYPSEAIAVNSSGEILVQSFMNNHIINVYSQKGKIIRSFGRLFCSFGDYVEDFDKLPLGHQKMLNLASFCLDRNDNLYVAFKFYPVIRKYDRNGNLLFEKIIRGKEIDKKLGTSKPEIGPGTVRAKVVFLDIKINPRDKSIIVPLSPYAYKLDQNGELIGVHHFKINGDFKDLISRFIIMGNGKAFFCGFRSNIYTCQF